MDADIADQSFGVGLLGEDFRGLVEPSDIVAGLAPLVVSRRDGGFQRLLQRRHRLAEAVVINRLKLGAFAALFDNRGDGLLVGVALTLDLGTAEHQRPPIPDKHPIDGHGALLNLRLLIVGDLERQGRQREVGRQVHFRVSPGRRRDGGIGKVARQRVQGVAGGDVGGGGALAPAPLVLLELAEDLGLKLVGLPFLELHVVVTFHHIITINALNFAVIRFPGLHVDAAGRRGIQVVPARAFQIPALPAEDVALNGLAPGAHGRKDDDGQDERSADGRVHGRRLDPTTATEDFRRAREARSRRRLSPRETPSSFVVRFESSAAQANGR